MGERPSGDFSYWVSDRVVRAFDCCVGDLWFEENPRAEAAMLAHCPPSNKWESGGKLGGERGEEGNWLLYFIMPTAQDKLPHSKRHPPPPMYGILALFNESSRRAIYDGSLSELWKELKQK